TPGSTISVTGIGYDAASYANGSGTFNGTFTVKGCNATAVVWTATPTGSHTVSGWINQGPTGAPSPYAVYGVQATSTSSPFCSSDLDATVVILESVSPVDIKLDGNSCAYLDVLTASSTATGGGSGTATLTFATQGSAPFTPGQTITVSGMTPAGYNGNWVVLSCNTTTVTFTSNATGAATVLGSLGAGCNFNYCTGGFGPTPTIGVSDAEIGVSYVLTKDLLGTTGATTTAGVSTITFAAQPQVPFAVGSSIVVSGVNSAGSGFNGTKTVTASTTTSVSYTGITASAHTLAGTVSQSVETIVPSATGAFSFATGVTTPGVYTVVSNSSSTGCGAVKGAVKVVNVTPPTISVTTPTMATSYCPYNTISLTGTLSIAGTSPYDYEWSGPSSFAPAATTGSVSNTNSTTRVPVLTTAMTGNYNVTVTDANSCSATATSPVLTVNPLPVSQALTTLLGPGPFCVGPTRNFRLTDSESNFRYGLARNGDTATANLVALNAASAGGAFTFSPGSNLAGTYSVIATTNLSCTAMMSNDVVVNDLPAVQTISPASGTSPICALSTQNIQISGSQAGVNYQLVLNGTTNIGAPVAGTGSAISPAWSTASLASGTYTVVATNATSLCTSSMTGSVLINPVPVAQTMNPTGIICATGAVAIGLTAAETGVEYLLMLDAISTGSTHTAISTAAFSFSPDQSASGDYTVIGTYPATGCSVDMGNTLTIAPAPITQTVTGGGPYCFGPTATIGLDNSETGVSYQLFAGASPVGPSVPGTNAAISFGNHTAVGTYTVKATFGSCTDLLMAGSVVINPVPVSTFTVTGGGNDCSDAPTGFTVGLNGSESGFSYLLYRDGDPTGETLSGTGAALTFSNQLLVGNYTIVGSAAGCVATMTGSVDIIVNPSPTVFTVTGAGAVCSGGGGGVAVGLSGSETGFNYQLYNGVTPAGSPVAGTTGSPISFGLQTSTGTYTAVATHSTTGCSGNMSGSAEVTVTTSPDVPTVTPVQTPACGSTVLDAVLTGVGRIYWQNTSSTDTSSAIESSSETVTSSGTYYFRAANDGCWGTEGSATVTINPLPPTPVVTPVGSVCSDAVLQATVSGGFPAYWQGNATGGTSAAVTTASTGANLAFTITVTSAVGIYNDMLVTGTNIAAGATVTDVTGNVVTLSDANTGAVNSNITFTNPGSPQTVDLSGTYYYRSYNAATGCFSNDGSYTVNLSTLNISVGINNCMNVNNAVYTVTGTGITTGGTTFTVSSAIGLAAGMSVTGTGIAPNAIVTSIAGTTVTVDQAHTSTPGAGVPVDFTAFDNKYVLLGASGGVAPYVFSTDGFGQSISNANTSTTVYATGTSASTTIVTTTTAGISIGMTVSGTGGLATNASVVSVGSVSVNPTVTSGSIGSATIIVDNAAGIVPGLAISGIGIPANTRVIAVAGLTLTLSANATVDPDGYVMLVSGGNVTLSLANTTNVGGMATFTRNSPVFEQPLVNGILSSKYIVTDINGCSQDRTVDVTPGHPTDIPYKNTAGTTTVTCFDLGFNKWLTFRDPANLDLAILSINDNTQNLGFVRVDLYRDAIETMAPIYGVCTGHEMAAMRRHFVVTPTNQPQTGTSVGVRLFFSHDELDSLKVKSMANNLGNNPECEETDDVAAIGDLFVTKYHGPTEDGSWANNNLAAGYYKVFDNTLGTSDPQYLAIESDGFNNIFNPGAIYQRHYVEMKATELSEFWIHGSFYGAPLPVEFIMLEASAMENTYIQVRWATSLEINNAGFDVERSTDAQNWTRIGWVDGHNNSTVRNDYHLNDYNVTPGIRYYYRLKQVDNDAQFEYTGIVSAIINDKLTFSVKDFRPNPTMDETVLIVIASKEQQIKVDMYDVIGRKIIATTHQLNRGSNKIDFSLGNFASGTYTAVVSSANEVYTKKLVLTR
ncbi:MAG: T9SS type A sorting domain-containing protein, partial [Bacteroidota bacterium]